jgi:hypothetical protein
VRVALEEGAAVLAGGDDGEVMGAGDVVDARGGDGLELKPAAAALKLAQPVGALQAEVDREG